MNYQQKRHVQVLHANNLRSIAFTYEEMAKRQRLLNVQIADLSAMLTGSPAYTADELLAMVRMVGKPVLPYLASLIAAKPEVVAERRQSEYLAEEVDTGKYPAKKVRKRGRRGGAK